MKKKRFINCLCGNRSCRQDATNARLVELPVKETVAQEWLKILRPHESCLGTLKSKCIKPRINSRHFSVQSFRKYGNCYRLRNNHRELPTLQHQWQSENELEKQSPMFEADNIRNNKCICSNPDCHMSRVSGFFCVPFKKNGIDVAMQWVNILVKDTNNKTKLMARIEQFYKPNPKQKRCKLLVSYNHFLFTDANIHSTTRNITLKGKTLLDGHNKRPLPVFEIRTDNLGAAILATKTITSFEKIPEQVEDPKDSQNNEQVEDHADSQNRSGLWSWLGFKS